MGTVTKSVTVIPSGTTGRTNMTTSSSYPESRGYNNTSHSSFARWTLSTSTTGYIYYTFDTSEIPSGATITSVTAKARCYVNNTTRVTNTVCQLYSGTTAKGSNKTFASTSNTNIATLSTGSSWSRSDLNDLRIRIGATGGTSSSSKYVYFAGAEVVISYSVTTYDITIQNSTTATVTASESSVAGGDDVEIFADTINGITIRDNGVDVTNQFVQLPDGSVSAVPGSHFTTGFSSSSGNFYQNSSTTSTSWLQYAIGHSAESPYSTSNTSNTYVKPEGSTGWINYEFDFSEIPEVATIKSVSVKVYGAREDSTIDTSHVARFQCYSGSTAKGAIQNFTSTSNSAVTVSNVGTWTASELQDAQLRFEIGYYGGRMLGITWTVTYSVEGYVYTITAVASDHVIIVGPSNVLWVKDPNETLLVEKTISGVTTSISGTAKYYEWSQDLSGLVIGDTVRVFATLYLVNDGVITNETNVSFNIEWNGATISYGVSYFTLWIGETFVRILYSESLPGSLYARTPNGDDNKFRIYKFSDSGWTPATRAYKKVNGSWVEQSDLTAVFSSGVNYVKG